MNKDLNRVLEKMEDLYKEIDNLPLYVIRELNSHMHKAGWTKFTKHRSEFINFKQDLYKDKFMFKQFLKERSNGN